MNYDNKFEKIRKISLATTNKLLVDNAIVNVIYFNGAFFFGSFDYTTKCRFIEKNNLVAIAFDEFQIHCLCKKIEKNDNNFTQIHNQYEKKFPSIAKMIYLDNNYYYMLVPLVIWKYNYSTNKRETTILNEKYYKQLNPYDNILK